MKLNALIIFLFVGTSLIAQSTWNIDKSHSKIGFSATHMVVAETEGLFKDYDATITSKSDDFNGADVAFTAKVASIFTDNERRDNHLKSADFFDAEKYPEIKFIGKLVKSGNAYKLKGAFTMKETTKEVEFNVTYGGSIDTGRGTKAGFKINGTINRLDYGVSWSNKTPAGEWVVSEDVDLTIKVELNKQA